MDLTQEVPTLTGSQLVEARVALGALEALVGFWRGSGSVADPDGPMAPMTSTEVFQWLDGRYFLEHRWDWRIGERRFSGVELLGYDPMARSLFSKMFDNGGHHVVYQVVRDGNVFVYEGRAQRARLHLVAENGELHDRWEQKEADGRWRLLCDVVWRRENA